MCWWYFYGEGSSFSLVKRWTIAAWSYRDLKCGTTCTLERTIEAVEGLGIDNDVRGLDSRKREWAARSNLVDSHDFPSGAAKPDIRRTVFEA